MNGVERRNTSFTSSYERSLVQHILPRLPKWVTSDMLTALGLSASIASGVLYVFVDRYPWFLFVINGLFIVNWFGDSLDGGLARFRKKERPRFGDYIDQIADCIGLMAICAGATFSSITVRSLWIFIAPIWAVIYNVTYVSKVHLKQYSVSFGRLGPTEMRLTAILVNTIGYFLLPARFTFLGIDYTFFDLVGLVVAILLGIAGVSLSINVGKRLLILDAEDKV